jgi:hypothetical protein
VTSAVHGSCGPFDYPGITGSGGSNTFVLNNMWNAKSGTTQNLTASNPGSWSVVANSAPPGSTAVQTYPDTQEIYTRPDDTPLPLSSFGSITSSFTEKMSAAGGTDAEAAYDIWLGQGSSTNYADEVMIWNDQENRGTCGGATVESTATFGGSNGVPQQNWTLCKFGGSELIWYLTSGNEQSGTVDVLSMLTWLESHGYLPAGSGLNQIDYGFEICSTPAAEAFTVSQFPHQSGYSSCRDVAASKRGNGMSKVSGLFESSWIRQHSLYSCGNFGRRRVFIDGLPDTGGHDALRVARLIVDLRDADKRHTRRKGRGDGAKPTVGDDSRHMRHE